MATDRLAQSPDAVSFAEASTLPTAGLTAHRALEKGGCCLGTRVLTTGSTGGVGLFAPAISCCDASWPRILELPSSAHGTGQPDPLCT